VTIAVIATIYISSAASTINQNLRFVESACSPTAGKASIFGAATANAHGFVLALANTGGATASVTGCAIYAAT
jgi:hypothetical protein